MEKKPRDVVFAVYGTYYCVMNEPSKKSCITEPPHAVVFNNLVNSRVASISLDTFELLNVCFDITEKEKRSIQVATVNHKQQLLDAYYKTAKE